MFCKWKQYLAVESRRKEGKRQSRKNYEVLCTGTNTPNNECDHVLQTHTNKHKSYIILI